MEDPFAVQGILEPDGSDASPWYYRLFFTDIGGVLECVGMELRSFAWQSERTYTNDGEHAGSVLANAPSPPRYSYDEHDHEQFFKADGSSADTDRTFPTEIRRGPRVRERMVPTALTTGLIRSLGFGRLVVGALSAREAGHQAAADMDVQSWAGPELRRQLEERSEQRKAELDRLITQVRESLSAKVGRGGRPSLYPTEFFGTVAEVYREALDRGASVVEAVSTSEKLRDPKDLSKPATPVSPDTAKKWISRARRFGFIPAAKPRSTKETPSGEVS